MTESRRGFYPEFVTHEEELKFLHRKIAYLSDQLRHQSDTYQFMQQQRCDDEAIELILIKKTLSWRMTRPLRQLKAWFNRYFRRW
jgi:hypothetical protein